MGSTIRKRKMYEELLAKVSILGKDIIKYTRSPYKGTLISLLIYNCLARNLSNENNINLSSKP